jgi:hypothetical protein
MAGRYRALLIGNSTYPADEHNLQALKGPVKDIAVLNRALADNATGLFADADVALLPEAAAARAIRAMGRFFGEAGRDDVLLFYFSGHGKLDQAGRLHLCMQDTETTDLLATAVSSARINEFADASHARNVVIVLDCCFSGAFRGGDLGDAVAGPGRYVLTSCRGTQLANDATAENSTSHFTQHLVDGLLGAAADHDGDGYVSFSELYAYVDRRLREMGKQIPQQRVQGDGDLRLARRQSPAEPAAAPPERETALAVRPASKAAVADSAPAGPSGPSGGGQRAGRPRRTTVLVAAAVTAVAAAGAVTAILLTQGGGDGKSPGGTSPAGVTYTSPGAFAESSPWRLQVDGRHTTASAGCSLWVLDGQTGAQVRQLTDGAYGIETYQVSNTGTFRWGTNDPNCEVTIMSGTGPMVTLPYVFEPQVGDTAVFAAPATLAVQVKDWGGGQSCDFRLYDPDNGTQLDYQTITMAQGDTVQLNPYGHKRAYLELAGCGARVSAVA